MVKMFYDASSFNQDIGGWSVGAVLDMYGMFYEAEAFDQDLSDWRVDKVTNMNYMFYEAEAFDQNLAWCVDNDVSLYRAFGTCVRVDIVRCRLTASCSAYVAPTSQPTRGLRRNRRRCLRS